MTSPNRYDAGKNPTAKTKTSSYGSGLLAKVGNAIGSALKTAGNAIKTATQYVGNKVSQGLQAVAKGVTATAAAVSTTILAASALGGVSKNSLGKKAATAVAKSGVKASIKLSVKGEDLSESIKEKGQELGNKVEKTGSNIQQVTQNAQMWWNENKDELVEVNTNTWNYGLSKDDYLHTDKQDINMFYAKYTEGTVNETVTGDELGVRTGQQISVGIGDVSADVWSTNDGRNNVGLNIGALNAEVGKGYIEDELAGVNLRFELVRIGAYWESDATENTVFGLDVGIGIDFAFGVKDGKITAEFEPGIMFDLTVLGLSF